MNEIIRHRKELEEELTDLLHQTESDFTLEDVKKAILDEKESGDMMKVVAMFDRGGDMSELSDVLELVTDAWNYFPHKALGGLSPKEKSLQFREENPTKTKNRDDQNSMPRVRVGNKEMSWDEHQAMLKEMEKAQKPFKKWISDVLIYYKIFLKQEGLSTKMADKYYFVAETFFDRVLWLGWLDFGSIRKEFIKDEFPRWWKTHVMASGIDDPKEVKDFVCKLVDFVEAKYKFK